LLVSISCTSNKKESEAIETIIVDLQENQSPSVFDIFSKIELIPIETNENILIKNVNKLIHYNNLYYVLDKHQKCIFIIDDRGNCIRKIDKRGKGPGEYTDISDFEINPYTDNLEILSAMGAIYIYDHKGEFIDSYSLPKEVRAVHYFANINKNVVAFYTIFEKKKLILYSKNESRIINHFFEVPKTVTGSLLSHESPFSRKKGTLLFYQGFTNTVYELHKSGLTKHYCWDFGKYNFNVDNLPTNLSLPELRNYFLSNQFASCFVYNIEDNRYISTRFICGEIWYSIFHDKLSHKNLVFDKFKEELSPPFSAVTAQNGLVTITGPGNISLFINAEVIDETEQQKLDRIQFDDNPIILHYHYN
jgi:hypothetical protein